MNTGINRIRLEFKEREQTEETEVIEGINRIRLEFKATCRCWRWIHEHVLIESDWNLKFKEDRIF